MDLSLARLSVARYLNLKVSSSMCTCLSLSFRSRFFIVIVEFVVAGLVCSALYVV